MANNYRRGADAERAAMRLLTAEGWPLVIRSAGSKSPADLVALGPGGVLLIQCKSGAAARKSPAATLRRLAAVAVALPPGVRCELWLRRPRRGWERLSARSSGPTPVLNERIRGHTNSHERG